MFNFQYSSINQHKFEQLAEIFLKFSMFYATSKLDVGKHIHQYIFRLNHAQVKTGHLYDFAISQVDQKNTDQNTQQLFMSDLKLIHKLKRF